jgi:hypothetical protein
MTYFAAGFTYDPTLIFAPQKVEFTNTTSIGYLQESEFTVIMDEDGLNPLDITIDYSTTYVNKVDFYSWDFGDKTYSNETSPTKLYQFYGDYNVSLSAISEKLYDETTGQFYRVKSSAPQIITINSMVVAWLKSHMTTPHLKAYETSQGFRDLLFATSKLFDNMYKKIYDVSNIYDVEHTPSEFLKLFSDTLNHKEFYAKKIGYSEQDSSDFTPFLDYDIFQKIENGTATESEIDKFRLFIIETSDLFKQKGSAESINEFFKLYDFTTDVKDMWTQTFGITVGSPIIDYFFVDPTLEKTNNEFKFKGINVIGWDNSLAQFVGGVNDLTIDNYRYVSRHSYPADIIDSESNNCLAAFEVHEIPPNIHNVQRDDGRSFIEEEIKTCGSESLSSLCFSPVDLACRIEGFSIENNPSYVGNIETSFGGNYKIWKAPDNYVQRIITTFGYLPTSPLESEEGTYGDPNDDYLWANWNSGVTVPPQIVGVSQSQLTNPEYNDILPAINYVSTSTNPNLFQLDEITFATDSDVFVCVRGFVKVSQAGYYKFSLDVGNTGNPTDLSQQHVGLFSLSETKYTLTQIKALQSIDNIQFARISGTTLAGVIDNGVSIPLTIANTEYGLIEIKQNESEKTSDWKYLTAGYYPFEVKTTYGSSAIKKIKLSWQMWEELIGTTASDTRFINYIIKQVIPTSSLYTLIKKEKTIEDTLGKGILYVPTTVLEVGEIVKIAYETPNPNRDIVSGILSKKQKYKDVQIKVRFTPDNVRIADEVLLSQRPLNSFQILFRGLNRGKDLYADVDSYYALMFNGKTSEFSLAYVGYDANLEIPYYRYLNLNPDATDLDQRIFSTPILDSFGHLIELNAGTFYDIDLTVQDNKVSIKFRTNTTYTNTYNAIKNTEEIEIDKYVDNVEYETIISEVSLIQDDAQTDILDVEGKIVEISDKYEPIDESGYCGFAVQSASIKINRFFVQPLDLVDEKLNETVDKWKEIKPKWLDSRDDKVLQANSYGLSNVDKPTSSTFRYTVTENYNGQTVYDLGSTLGEITDNSVNKVFVDNISADAWGSRFNVIIDETFIKSTFTKQEDILNSLYISYGSFYEPFINWTRIGNVYESSAQAGMSPILSDTFTIMPHTVAISGGQVLEYISQLTRSSDFASLTLETTLNTILKSSSNKVFNGLWEEVCPFSVSEKWNIPRVGLRDNEVFAPIYRNKSLAGTSSAEVIGVRVINSDTMDKLICRYCDQSTVWGLFDITLPSTATSNYPKYTDETINLTTIRYFIPIGKLQKDTYIFLPPAEILKGGGTVNLLGVYANKSFDGFTFADSADVEISIQKYNYWEDKYSRRIRCNYYLDVQTGFAEKFTSNNIIPIKVHTPTSCEPGEFIEKADNINTSCDKANLPNAFYVPETIVNIIKTIEAKYPTKDDADSDTLFTNEYNWWVPKKVWMKRDVEVRYSSDKSASIFSGLTSDSNSGTKVVLTGTTVSLSGDYLLESEWCVSSTSWDHDFAVAERNTFGIGTFSPSGTYSNIGFEASETRFTIDTEQLIPIDVKMNAFIPLETKKVNGETTLTVGSYINADSTEERSIMPVGLFNWFNTHANNDYLNDANNRAEWTNEDWNEEFMSCFTMKSAFVSVPSSVIEINKYWAFYQNYVPPFAAIPKISYSNSKAAQACDPENYPESFNTSITLGVSDGLIAFYQVPPIVQPYNKWRRFVDGVFVDHYILPNDYYYISSSTVTNTPTLVLNNQQFDFSRFLGDSSIIVEFYFDNIFKNTESKVLVDDFNQTRDMKWVSFIQDENDNYVIGKRTPDTTLKFTTDSTPYEITTYKGKECYKASDKFENTNPNQFSGEADVNKTVGINNDYGYRDVIVLSDVESYDYEVSCDVIFDKDIIDNGYQKKFELILKAENNYNKSDFDWGISDFYFVGFGTYNFDIGLGMRSYDQETKALNETYLASWGEYNTRSIKVDTWYTISARVTTDSIKIYFNERGEDRRLILNYNTNKKYEKLSERYLKGEYETLQAVLIGLEELGVTYPAKLGNKVSSEYTLENFKNEFAATLPVNGFYSGFRVFNPNTYVGTAKITVNTPKQYTFSTTTDEKSLNGLLNKVKVKFNTTDSVDVQKYDKSRTFVEYVQLDSKLYYSIEGKDPNVFGWDVESFYVVQDKVFILQKQYKTDSGIGVNYWGAGDHTIIWSIEAGSDSYGIVRLSDFFDIIDGLSRVVLVRNGAEYVAELDEEGNVIGSKIALKIEDEITFTIDCTLLALQTLTTDQLNDELTIRELDALPIDPVAECVSVFSLDGKPMRYDIIVRVFNLNLNEELPILIKDNTFYHDTLDTYMDFAQKKVKEIYINDNRFNLIFEDI